MKTRHPVFIMAGVLFLFVVIGGVAAFALGGVRGARLKQVIVTFELRGVSSQSEARSFLRRFEPGAGMLPPEVALGSFTERTWIARVRFHAADPEGGQRQIAAWLQRVSAPVEVRLVKATFYPCRILRPGRGDVVLGQPVVLSAGH